MISSNRTFARKAVLMTAMLCGTTGQTWAQTATPADAGRAQAEEAVDSFSFDTIIVTATRRPTPLQDVAIATTVLSGDALQAAGVSETNRLAFLTPNLTIGGTADSQPKFTLRGVGTLDQFQNLNPAVGINVDDVYNGLGTAQTFSLFDIERIEVLRGPQGTLYGKNSTGGTINILSRRPVMGTEGGVALSYGRFDRLSAEGYVNVGLTDVLAARASFQLLDRDGYSFNDADGTRADRADRWSGRLQVLLEPSESTEVIARIDGGRNRGDLKTRRFAGTLIPDATNPRGFVESGLAGGIDTSDLGTVSNVNTNPAGTVIPYSDTPSQTRFSSNVVVPDDIDQWGASLSSRFEIGKGIELRSISAYRELTRETITDSDVSALDLFETGLNNESRYFSQEIRLNGSVGRLEWILGGHYYRERHIGANYARVFGCFFTSPTCRFNYIPLGLSAAQLNGLALFPGQASLLSPSYRQNNESIAAFAEGRFELTPQIALTAGIRYTSDRRAINASLASNNRFLGTAFAPTSFSKTFNDVSGRVVAEYKPVERVLVFASYATAFKAGNYNGGFSRSLGELQGLPAPTPPNPNPVVPSDFDPARPYPVRPENIEAYEIGIKADLLRNLRSNFSAFYYDYTDLQVLTIVNTISSLRNASAAQIWGLEGELAWRPVSRLDLRVAAGYLNTEYQDFFDVVRDPTTGANTTFDRSGNRLVNAPELSITGGFDYSVPVSNDLILTAGGDLRYQSRVFFQPDNIRRLSQPGYVLATARAGIERADSGLALTLLVENLFDKSYILDGSRNGSPFFADSLTFGTPRMWTVQLSARF